MERAIHADDMIAGVLAYDAGSVDVFGERVDSEICGVNQEPHRVDAAGGLNLSPDLSIEENIDDFASVRLVPG